MKPALRIAKAARGNGRSMGHARGRTEVECASQQASRRAGFSDRYRAPMQRRTVSVSLVPRFGAVLRQLCEDGIAPDRPRRLGLAWVAQEAENASGGRLNKQSSKGNTEGPSRGGVFLWISCKCSVLFSAANAPDAAAMVSPD